MSDSLPAEPLRDKGKRRFLYLSTAAVGALGAAFAVWPLIDSMNPAAGVNRYDLKVDLTDIREGQSLTAVRKGLPIFIRHRTPSEIEAAQNVNLSDLRDPERDSDRTQMPQWLVVLGLCTRRGCIPLGQKPTDHKGDFGGWFCPCGAAHYDTSGRIRKGPAPKNLPVPKYDILDNKTLAFLSTPRPPKWP